MTETKPLGKHHHGNLRAALIEAGVALVRNGGVAALSLRKCAANAGVSHAAPAHHFGGLDGLKRAIAENAFELFADRMEAFSDQTKGDPRARLRGIARGYMAFAREEPALFDMIFSFRPLPEQGQTERPKPTAPDHSRSYNILREACAPFVPRGTDPRVIETQVWSLVHGLALLILSGRFGDAVPSEDAVLALLDRVGTASDTSS